MGRSSAPASARSLRSASSVKVPLGPRKPITAPGATSPVIGGQDRCIMDEAAVRKLLDQLTAGEVDADEVVSRLRSLPYTELGYATLDSHRELRQGLPEAVYAPGKSAEHCVGIVDGLLSSSDGPVLVSRASAEQINSLTAAHAGA